MGEFGKIGYNKAWIKKVGREKALKHFNEVLPERDHTEAIDEIDPPKTKKPEASLASGDNDKTS
jgi:hypothetical protein